MKKLILTILLIVGLALMGANAYALSYAVSYDNVFEGTVVFDNLNTVAFPPVTTSATDASLDTVGPSNSDVGDGLRDAAVAIGTGSDVNRTENYFSKIGASGNYSHGDAQVVSIQDLGGSTLQAFNIAEGNLDRIGTAESRGNNSSATLIQIQVNEPTQATFNFKTHPYLEVFLAPGLSIGSKAETELNMSVVITDASTGDTVFEWNPDGLPGGIVGGNEISDPFSMNTSRVQLLPGTQIYDPTGQGDTALGSLTPGSFGTFTAETNQLQPGLYNLLLQAANRQSLIVLSDGTQPGACRMTGGSVTVNTYLDEDGIEKYFYEYIEGTYTEANVVKGNLKKLNEDGDLKSWVTTGGQIGAPSIDPATGHWTHTQHAGAEGLFTFLSGTASAPPGTEISNISCADEGWCVQARCAPYKQIFWDGIGYFPSKHEGDVFDAIFDNCPTLTPGGPQKDGSLHYYRASVGDFGETKRNERQISENNCEWHKPIAEGGAGGPSGFDVSEVVELDSVANDQFAYKGGQDCDNCPDFYQIEIHCTSDPNSAVIYTFRDYIDGGNFQIHPETSEQCFLP